MAKEFISHYKIRKRLGHGGMAEVYEAVDTRTDQFVALKVLLPHLATDTVVKERFLREAKVGMQLDHPGIVKVYEVGEDEQPFIAMELVRGKTLDRFIEKESLDLEETISIAQQIAQVLSTAHKQGIIHRDLKPRNIMMVDGQPKIMDFGLARVVDTSSLTEKHEIIGTLYYMSPEQAIGETIDGRSDIFSLGVILYQMLTGRRPFDGEHAGTVIHAILYSEPLRFSDIKKKLPKEAEQVIIKALQKKADKRYQSAIDLNTDLEGLLDILQGKSVSLIASDVSIEEVFEKHRGIYSALVGREKEMEILQKHLTQMLQGKPSAILISGEAGVGKSRLVWELGQRAKKQDARYLVGRCVASGGMPYKPILEVIRQYFDIRGIKSERALNQFIDKHTEYLRYRKDIVATLALKQLDKEVNIINKEQLWDTATEIIRTIARDRPAVIHLDDLHWADAPTLDMLTYNLRNNTDERVLIISTYRPEDIREKENPLRIMLKKTNKESLFAALPLHRLGKEGTENIIRSVFENSNFRDEFAESIHKETEGNPLFVLEVLKLLRDENVITRHNTGWRLPGKNIKVKIPETVTDVISRRLEKLNREERELIDIAAVEGISFQSDTLAHCLDQSRIKVLRQLQNLESSHNLIHASMDGYHFDHGKIKDVVYDNLIPELKKEYHKIMGEYFRESFSDKDAYAGRIAHHMLTAGEEKTSITFLVKAGDYSTRLYATIEALQYFDNAIEHIDKILETTPKSDFERVKLDIYKKRHQLNFFTTNYKEAQVDIENILELSRKVKVPEQEIYAMTRMAVLRRRHGDFKESIKYHKRAIRAARKIGDKHAEADNLSHWGCINWECDDYDWAFTNLGRALTIHRQIGDKFGEALDLYNIGTTYFFSGAFKKAFEYLRQSLKVWKVLGIKSQVYTTLSQIGWIYVFSGEPKKGEMHFRNQIREMRRMGNKYHMNWALLAMARAYLDQGKYSAALAFCNQPLELGRQIPDKKLEIDALMITGKIYYHLGNFKETKKCTKRALILSKQCGMPRLVGLSLKTIGSICTYQADYKKASDNLESAFEIIKKYASIPYIHGAQLQLYKMLKYIGDNKGSLDMLNDMVQTLSKENYSYSYVMHNLDMAELNLRRRKYDDAILTAQRGLARAEKIALADGRIRGLMLLTQLEIARKAIGKSKRYAKKLLGLAEKFQRKIAIIETHLLLAKINLQSNDNDLAISHARDAQNMASRCNAKEFLWKAHCLRAKAYAKKKNFAKAKQEFAKAEKMVDKIASKLTNKMKRTYFKKKEIRELKKDTKKLEHSRKEVNHEGQKGKL